VKPNSDVKVLVVEDDPFFSRVLQKRLSVEGYKVQSAADGREGMKLIVSFEPDLVISDWMMPEVDGLELCQSVKTGLGDAAPYFILLTAKGEIDDRLLGLQTGADDYLVKPCDQAELMARVRAGLRIVLLSQELRQAVNELKLANAELEAARSLPVRIIEQLPACSICKKIRDDDGTWLAVDEFLVAHDLAEFTHGVCPSCRTQHHPKVAGPEARTQG
jgi:DNA-binding response OmpR family regulator